MIHIHIIQSFEIWCNGRKLRISWTQRKTNIEVLREMGKRYELKNKNSFVVEKLECRTFPSNREQNKKSCDDIQSPIGEGT